MIEKLLEAFNLEDHIVLWLVGAFSLAFIIAYYTFPTILYVSKEKHLMDESDGRSIHSGNVPTFGGIGVFLSLVVVITISGAMLNTKVMLLVLGSLTILFFLGLKDDLTVLSPRKKFLGQLFAALLLIVFTDTRIIGFSSILDIYTLPYWISIGFTLFVYILIINAYNLIDGVDGLAGSIALCASAVFTFVFVTESDYSLATLSVALIGALIPFLKLNFSKKNKIFMGDTGSMIVGFLLAFFAISFISNSQTNELSEYFRYSPALVFAILFYPLMDTLRIFIIRIFIHKKSPFEADQNHIHHRFIQHGFSHIATTIIITLLNLLITIIAFNSLEFNLNTQVFALLIYGSILYMLPFLIKIKKGKRFNVNKQSIE